MPKKRAIQKQSNGKTGSQRMTALGKRTSQLWLKPEVKDLLQRAAAIEGRSLANFIKHHTLQAAKRIVKEDGG